MHSKLQGLAKPNRLSMPRPAGECPWAVSSEPHAGCIAWKNGEKLTELGPPGHTQETEDGTAGHTWPRVVQRTTTARRLVNGQRKPEKIPGEGGRDVPETPEAERAREGTIGGSATERCTEQHRREHVVDSDDQNGDDEHEMAGGQRQRSAVAPQPGIRDHHSRFKEKLTAWNCVEVVVGSKLLDLFNIYLYYQRS